MGCLGSVAQPTLLDLDEISHPAILANDRMIPQSGAGPDSGSRSHLGVRDHARIENLNPGSYDRIGDSGSGSHGRSLTDVCLTLERHHGIERYVLLNRNIEVHISSF